MGGILHKVFSFRSRLVVIAVGLVIGVSSLLFTNNMAAQLREKEKNEVDIWVAAFRELGADPGNPLLLSIITTRNNIPFVLIDRDQRVIASHLIPEHILNHPDLLNQKLVELAEINPRIKVETLYNETFYIFFDESKLLKSLTYFPYIQLLVIIVFVLFGYIALRSTKQDEQNRVWIGLAKETAHQLGTPTSSLLGWLEYLRTQNIDPTAIAEMNKDIIRLTKVVDRFSKIGAATSLSEGVINEIVGNSVIYFRTRVPKNVTISYNGLAMAQQKAMINEALDYLEQVRARARGTNSSVLPKVTTTDQDELRDAIHHERHVELALEFDRFYDLVRWNEAVEVLGKLGYTDKNRYLPLPQTEIDASNGVLVQNPDYAN